MRGCDLQEHRRVRAGRHQIAAEQFNIAIQEHNVKAFVQIVSEEDKDYRKEQESCTVEHKRLVETPSNGINIWAT